MSQIKESYSMPKGFEKSFINPKILVEFMIMSIISGILWWKTNSVLQIPMAIYWVALIYYCLRKDYESKKTKTNIEVTLDYFNFLFRKKGNTIVTNQDYNLLKQNLEKKNKKEHYE